MASGSSKGWTNGGHLPSVVFLFAALAGLASAVWYHKAGRVLDIGDAAAHVNIARRLLDSRDISPLLLGTGWLPLPHILMAPFAANNWLWITGLAGAAVNVPVFAAAVMAIFLLVRELGNTDSAIVAAAVLALNPSLLYLAATPMTEPLSICLILWALYWAATRRPAWCGVFATLACLARYEAWVMLPLLAVYLWWQMGFSAAARFAAVGALGPLWWFAHNWWYWGDALEFYRGEYSAKAIYARELAEGTARYPAEGSWRLAIAYYARAAELVLGYGLLVTGVLGWGMKLFRGDWQASASMCALLLAPGLLVVWTLQAAGTQIYVTGLWPNSLMNTRYALVMLPWMAAGAGWLAEGSRKLPIAVAFAVFTAWAPVIHGGEAALVREAHELGRERKQWTAQAAAFLKRNYHGGGIALSFGDLTAVFEQADVPIREALYDGSRLQFESAVARPDLFLQERWVLAMEGDRLARAAARSKHYRLVRRFQKAELWLRLPDFTAANPVSRR